jgi:hypothetical protein
MDCSKSGANERAMASGKPIPHQGIDQELAMGLPVLGVDAEVLRE